MFGFGKSDKADLISAEAELKREFGIKLDEIPDRRPVDDLFEKLAAHGKLSYESKVALLYRLVAMNYLAACKIMRDKGRNTSPDDLLWLTNLLDRSVDWSEKARDHVVLEGLTSQLNMNIQRFMASFHIYQGKSGIY
jgi:hypothetical protein